MSNHRHPEALVDLAWTKVNIGKPKIKFVEVDLDTASYESSHAWLVLKYLPGLAEVKNYDGRWTGYGNLICAPIENPSGGSSGTK